MDEEKARKISKSTCRQTKASGIGLHQIKYEKIEIPVHLLTIWMHFKTLGIDVQGYEDHFWNMDDDERNDILYTNRSSLDPQDLLREGFRVDDYSLENEHLNIAVTRV